MATTTEQATTGPRVASDHVHVCVIYIKAGPADVWRGLTNPEFTRQYFHSTAVESSWREGEPVTFRNADSSVAVRGEVLAADPPNRLSFTWHVHYNADAQKEPPSRVTYELETVADATKLTVTHDRFVPGSVVYPAISAGWIAILCNLKTLLETGDVMAVS